MDNFSSTKAQTKIIEWWVFHRAEQQSPPNNYHDIMCFYNSLQHKSYVTTGTNSSNSHAFSVIAPSFFVIERTQSGFFWSKQFSTKAPTSSTNKANTQHVLSYVKETPINHLASGRFQHCQYYRCLLGIFWTVGQAQMAVVVELWCRTGIFAYIFY